MAKHWKSPGDTGKGREGDPKRSYFEQREAKRKQVKVGTKVSWREDRRTRIGVVDEIVEAPGMPTNPLLWVRVAGEGRFPVWRDEVLRSPTPRARQPPKTPK